MKNKHIFTLAITVLVAAGCIQEGMTSEEFISSAEDISLTINGKRVMTYKEGTHQLGYNDEDVIFRVSDDRFSNFFIVNCLEVPQEEGQKTEAVLTYTTADDTIERYCNFTVSKIDGDRIWLWDGSKKIGAVVRLLR